MGITILDRYIPLGYFHLMEHLKKYRTDHRITQSEMAERLGVRQSTISRIENGELPSLALAARIQAATDDIVKASSWITEGPAQ